MTAELQVRLVDTLLQDNDSLRRRLGAGSRGKAGLRGAASRPKETLQAIRVGAHALRAPPPWLHRVSGILTF